MFDSEAPDETIAPGLWNFLVAQGAIPTDSLSSKNEGEYVLNKTGRAALSSGYSTAVVVKKLLGQGSIAHDDYKIKASNKAQDRLANWQWVSDAITKLSPLNVQPFDSSSKMLLVSGDLGVILAGLTDLKVAHSSISRTPVRAERKLPSIETSHSRNGLASSSTSPTLRPVIQPMSAVRIDRVRQVLVQKLKACVGEAAGEELLPTSEAFQTSQGFEGLHHALIHGFAPDNSRDPANYKPLVLWISALLEQRMPNSDLTHFAAALRLVKDAVSVKYVLNVFAPGLRSRSSEVVVGASRALCFVCEKVNVELLTPLWMWFFEPDSSAKIGEGLEILLDAFRTQKHLCTTLFRVMRAAAGSKLVQVLTDKLWEATGTDGAYMGFMADILPIMGTEEIESKQERAISNFVLDLGLRHASQGPEVSADSVPAMQMLTTLWTAFPHFLPSGSKLAEGVIDALRFNCKEGSPAVKLGSLSCSLDLLYALTRAKHKSAALIYKSLVFSLIETHVGVVEGMPGVHVVHQFLQANLKIALRRLNSLPVQVMVEPLIKQHVAQGYNNLDLNFLHSVCGHPRLGVRQALLLLHFVAKVALNDLIYGPLASKLVFKLLERFPDQPPVHNYLVKYMRVAFSLLIKSTERVENARGGGVGGPGAGEENPSDATDNRYAGQRLQLVESMLCKLWACMSHQLPFKSQVSPLATTVVRDYQSFFPEREVPMCLRAISEQRQNLIARRKAPGVGEENKVSNAGSYQDYAHQENRRKQLKPHTSPGHKHSKSGDQYGAHPRGGGGKEKRPSRKKPHTAGESRGYSSKRHPVQHRNSGGGSYGGSGVPSKAKFPKSPSATQRKKDLVTQAKLSMEEEERQMKAKRTKMEARMRRRERERERERTEKDDWERERQKELQRQSIEDKTRKRIEKLKKERIQKQTQRQDLLGFTPDGTPLVPNDQAIWGDVDQNLWQEFKVQMKRLVRTYSGTRPDPVAKVTFSAINQANNTLSLAEFLKMWSDLKMSPHHVSRREMTQCYRTFGGKDQVFGAKQLCSSVRYLSQHDKLESTMTKAAGKSAGDLTPEERAKAMIRHLQATWKRCKYTPHNLWEPPKKSSKHRRRKSSSGNPEEIEHKTQELAELLHKNPDAEIPNGFEKKKVIKVKRAWPESQGAAQIIMNLILKKVLDISHDFGEPPEVKVEAYEVEYTGEEGDKDTSAHSAKTKYDPARKRRELEEKKRKEEEEKEKERIRKEAERQKRQKILAIKLEKAKEKKEEAKRKREEEKRRKEEEAIRRKEEEKKRQQVERKKRKAKIEKYRKQKEDEEKKKKEREEKMKQIQEEERKKQVAIYLKMKKEKEKVEAAKKKEMDALLAKQKAEEETKRVEEEAKAKAREDKRKAEAKQAVEMRRMKKEEEKKAAELARKAKEEQEKAQEVLKEKRMQERLARRAKQVKKKMSQASKSEDPAESSQNKAKSPKSPKSPNSPGALSDFAMTDDEKDTDKVVLQAVQVDDNGEALVGPDGKGENWKVKRESDQEETKGNPAEETAKPVESQEETAKTGGEDLTQKADRLAADAADAAEGDEPNKSKDEAAKESGPGEE